MDTQIRPHPGVGHNYGSISRSPKRVKCFKRRFAVLRGMNDQQSAFPLSTPAFDWTISIMGALVMAGVIQDGWAHNHGLVDQSFITPWHGMLYGMMALTGVVLGFFAVKFKRRGYPARRSLPRGYWTSLAGVILFIVGGMLDLLWHSLYGIEININALVSPTHLLLALGGALVFAGPLRSVAFQYGPENGGWKRIGPAAVSVLATITLLGFFTAYAQPIGDATTAVVVGHRRATAVVSNAYVMRADGSAQTRLTLGSRDDVWGAAASPDGKQIVYRSAAGGGAGAELFVASIGGTAVRQITHLGRRATQPAWSPDGKYIAFVLAPGGSSGEFALDVVPAAGGNPRSLMHGVTEVSGPAWSPDGTRIAFASRNGLRDQLAILPASGGTLRWLENAEDASWPAWSRDGRSIAFAQTRGNDTAIVSEEANGLHSPQVIAEPGDYPAWSRDGKLLAYAGSDGAGAQIFVVPAGGGAPRNISQLSGADASRPSFTPDGHIVFSSVGRPQSVHSQLANSFAEDANVIESVIIAGLLLLLVRRWRAPLGSMTFVLGFFALAMATQSDTYYVVPAALVLGILADIYLANLGDRARGGMGFYIFAFGVPCLLFTGFLLSVALHSGGLSWQPNLIFGSPIIAGFVGLLVAFCYDPPLRAA